MPQWCLLLKRAGLSNRVDGEMTAITGEGFHGMKRIDDETVLIVSQGIAALGE